VGLRPAEGNTVVLPTNKVALAFRVRVAISLWFSLLEPARILLGATVPGHPGGSTLAGYLGSAAVHHPSWVVVSTVVESTTQGSFAVSVQLAITLPGGARIRRAAAVPVRPGFEGVAQNAGLLLAAVGLPCDVVFAVVDPAVEPGSTLVMVVAVALSKGARAFRQAALVTVANWCWSRADDSRRPNGCQNSQKQDHPHL